MWGRCCLFTGVKVYQETQPCTKSHCCREEGYAEAAGSRLSRRRWWWWYIKYKDIDRQVAPIRKIVQSQCCVELVQSAFSTDGIIPSRNYSIGGGPIRYRFSESAGHSIFGKEKGRAGRRYLPFQATSAAYTGTGQLLEIHLLQGLFYFLTGQDCREIVDK